MTARRTITIPWLAMLVAAVLTLSLSLSAGAAEPDTTGTEETTAILVQSIHPAQVVLGDDGMEHVEYELMVTNLFSDPVTLTSVTTLDPAGKEIGRIDGATLAAATQALLTRKPTPAIDPSAAVAISMDLALKRGTVPKRVTHRIEYTLPDPKHAVIIGSTVVHGPEVPIDRRASIALSPPLEGDGWLISSGCCTPNVHRDLRLAINGSRVETAETFAIDFARVKDGRLHDGDGSQNEQHYAFGADVLAVADAKVVLVQDGAPEQVPEMNMVPTKQSDFGGNVVLLELRPDVYAVYAHLQPGSITVKVGDEVKLGQPLAKLGNTGPSSGPHLHFGLLDEPDLFAGRSLPFVLDRFTKVGTIDVATSTGDHLVITPASKHVRGAYPLFPGIVDLPE